MSLSRQFAAFVHALKFEDLPPAVVDRAKGVTLHALVSALLALDMPASKRSLALMQDEEQGGGGAATVLGYGAKLTKGGAAFVNAELILNGGKWDTYRMLTHPGSAIIPAGLAAAEVTGCSGRDFLTGIVAGYEVCERMASEFIPAVMARGFHAGPVFGIFGAAVAAAKIEGQTEEQLNGTIAQCVNLAAGNLEGNRSGGSSVREGAAVRNALLAVAMARQGARGGETSLEGEAGLYHSYLGNNRGELRYSFTGRNRADIAAITEGLGHDWMFLETLYRIYSTPGFNIAHVDVTAALCREQRIDWHDIEKIEAVVNWFETQYPSPAFPTPNRDGAAKVGSTQYFSAHGAVEGGFSVTRNMMGPPASATEGESAGVLALMHKVTLIPSTSRPLFAPRVTIFMKDGRVFTREGTGQEFIWDFDEEVRRISPAQSATGLDEGRFERLVEACRALDGSAQANTVIPLACV